MQKSHKSPAKRGVIRPAYDPSFESRTNQAIGLRWNAPAFNPRLIEFHLLNSERWTGIHQRETINYYERGGKSRPPLLEVRRPFASRSCTSNFKGRVPCITKDV